MFFTEELVARAGGESVRNHGRRKIVKDVGAAMLLSSFKGKQIK